MSSITIENVQKYYGNNHILKGFDLAEGEEGLVVLNPPTVRFSDESEITNDDLASMVK